MPASERPSKALALSGRFVPSCTLSCTLWHTHTHTWAPLESSTGRREARATGTGNTLENETTAFALMCSLCLRTICACDAWQGMQHISRHIARRTGQWNTSIRTTVVSGKQADVRSEGPLSPCQSNSCERTVN